MENLVENVMKEKLSDINSKISAIRANLELYESVILKTGTELQDYLQQKNDILAQFPQLIPIEEEVIVEEPIEEPTEEPIEESIEEIPNTEEP